jgi:feruloyl-CoA synthase
MALRSLANDNDCQMSGDELAAIDDVRRVLTSALTEFGAGLGSSQRPTRALLLSTPPCLERGEITDKGYVNQRAVLTLRAMDVERLYSNHHAVIRVR